MTAPATTAAASGRVSRAASRAATRTGAARRRRLWAAARRAGWRGVLLTSDLTTPRAAHDGAARVEHGPYAAQDDRIPS